MHPRDSLQPGLEGRLADHQQRALALPPQLLRSLLLDEVVGLGKPDLKKKGAEF